VRSGCRAAQVQARRVWCPPHRTRALSHGSSSRRWLEVHGARHTAVETVTRFKQKALVRKSGDFPRCAEYFAPRPTWNRGVRWRASLTECYRARQVVARAPENPTPLVRSLLQKRHDNEGAAVAATAEQSHATTGLTLR
jgi:hypothetical protein